MLFAYNNWVYEKIGREEKLTIFIQLDFNKVFDHMCIIHNSTSTKERMRINDRKRFK